MRILFVSKRCPQQRDLWFRPYGRFFHIPRLLAEAGYEVHLALLGHRGEAPVDALRDGMSWISHDFSATRWLQGLRSLSARATAFRPDWVVGCSDAWVGVIAARLARTVKCSLALDAYDNYEAYMPWNRPLHALWRRALSVSQLATAAGPQLAERLDQHRRGRPPSVVVPMAADPTFLPMSMQEARRLIGLPAEAPLIGYSGGWAANRGTDLLLPMLRGVRRHSASARLLLTGRPPPEVLAEPGVISLGYVADEVLPTVLNAASVVAVVTTPGSFGDFSYPAKLYEAIACRRPIVATSTAPVNWILGGSEQALVPPGNVDAFVAKIVQRLGDGLHPGITAAGWTGAANTFARALSR